MNSNDTVIRNPKEAAVISGCIVVLAVCLEFVFSYFRQHRSSYVGGLFSQVSEETMIVGCISLLFVFIVQSSSSLPDSWVSLFRWAQGTIFFMILFFACGVIWTALITRVLCVVIQKFEFRLIESLARRQNCSVCEMLAREWHLSGSLQDKIVRDPSDFTIDDELRLLLQSNVNNLGRLRQEFGTSGVDDDSGANGSVESLTGVSPVSTHPSAQLSAARLALRGVERVLGDAALRLQDFFLDGSSFTTGGLRDPEPKGRLQFTLMILRQVFLHQARTPKYLPRPVRLLLVSAERLRVTAFVLLLESARRELLQRQHAKRDWLLHNRDAQSNTPGELEVNLTFQELMLHRDKKARKMIASEKRRQLKQQRERSNSAVTGPSIDELEESLLQSTDDTMERSGRATVDGEWSATEPLSMEALSRTRGKSSAEASEFLAEVYAEKQSELWVTDGCIDPEVLCRYVPFSKYLYKRMRKTMIEFVDITWQSWVSLVVLSSINSVRLYLLPGQLQSSDTLTAADYSTEMLSFIFVVGFSPMIAFLVPFAFFMRNFRWYLTSVKELRLQSLTAVSSDDARGAVDDTTNAGGPALSDVTSLSQQFAGAEAPEAFSLRVKRREQDNTGKKHAVGASVWLPPDQIAGQLSGDLYEDPSRYLLRGNMSFTQHTFKIPALLIHYYFSIFVVKLWVASSQYSRGAVLGYVLLGVVPVIVVFGLLPIALFAMTCLTSLGLRIDELEVSFIATRQARRTSGNLTKQRVSALDEATDKEVDEQDEITTMVASLIHEKRAAARVHFGGTLAESTSDSATTTADRSFIRSVLGFLPDFVPKTTRSVAQSGVVEASEQRSAIGEQLRDETLTDASPRSLNSFRKGLPSLSGASMAVSTVSSPTTPSSPVHHAVLQRLKHKVVTLEALLTKAEGLEVAPLVDSAADADKAWLQRSVSLDTDRFHRRGAEWDAATRAVAVSCNSDPEGVTTLLEYYRDLLLRQVQHVAKLKVEISHLKETQRGGVLNPHFDTNVIETNERSSRQSGRWVATDSSTAAPLMPVPDAVAASRTLNADGARDDFLWRTPINQERSVMRDELLPTVSHVRNFAAIRKAVNSQGHGIL